jgi:hypothetical protein
MNNIRKLCQWSDDAGRQALEALGYVMESAIVGGMIVMRYDGLKLRG